MTISATDILVPVCSKMPLLYLLTQKVAQKFGYVLGIEKGENIVSAKSNGVVKINVAEGGTYYILAAGTKLGFYGFKYEVGTSTGISSIEATSAQNGKTYNLAGQQVSDSYKGLVIKNGKKYVK